MSLISINLDVSAMAGILGITSEAEKLARAAGDRLMNQAMAKAVELATQRLHSRRDPFIDALSAYQEGPDLWVVQLDASQVWVDEGMCVVYGRSARHIPSVLTPDGWIKIVDVRPGMMVLNQYGKWTAVLQIHDNDLFDDCVEEVDEEASAQLALPVRKYDHRRGTGKRSKKPVIARCRKCGKRRKTTRFAMTDGAGVPHCVSCIGARRLVSFVLDRQGVNKKLLLTAEHPVLTDRGWVEAANLKREDRLFIPAWGACKSCGKKVAFGGSWCSGGCFQSHYQRELLKNGKHMSQDPGWKARYYKALGAKKVNSIEDVVGRLLEKEGLSVGFWGDGEFDWIRQYPIPSSTDSMGRQKYYSIDFYCPRLKLALEVDGHFHFTDSGIERDRVRDLVLKAAGIHPIHVPVSLISKGVFEKKTLPAILANHQGEIELIPTKIRNLKVFSPSRYFPCQRRWDITVEDGESFVFQGVVIHNSAHSMLDDLLASPKAKVAKDGSKYIVVPFNLNKAPTESTQAQRTLQDTVKSEMQKFGVPYGKIESHADGSPKLGVLHEFDIEQLPLKTSEGPGQGHGPVGGVRQGPTGIPFLRGVQVSQKMVGDKAKRFITTFRVASSKMLGQGRWDHPGLKPTDIMDDTFAWAKATWNDRIGPELIAQLVARLS